MLEVDKMCRSILIPLDGSATAEHALPTALALARRFEATLKVVHVHTPVWGANAEGGIYDALVDRELREEMQAYLDSVIQRLSEVTKVVLSSALLDGLVAGAINRHAMQSGVDLIVMTTQGRGPVSRFWFGSVADRLVRQSTIPILFVRAQESEADFTQEPEFGRVLIPLDGSQLAEQILEPTAALAVATNAEVTLLRVVQQLTPDGHSPDSGRVSGLRPGLLTQLQEMDRQEWQRAEEYLDQRAEQLRQRSLNAHTRVVSHRRPATAILDDASTHGGELIALATHGRGGLKRLLVGSVADKLLRGSTTAVLVYRPVGEFASAEE
jgi:nucleotide-binding universal stress UspA family protein